MLPWGMEFFWPDTKVTHTGYITNTTSICNYPVQSFATAEIIPVGLIYFWHRIACNDLKMFLVNTIHDSIIAEIPEEEQEIFNELAVQCLTHDVYQYLDTVYDIKFDVPQGS